MDPALATALDALLAIDRQLRALDSLKLLELEIARAESNIQSLLRAQHNALAQSEERSSSPTSHDLTSAGSDDSLFSPRSRSKTTLSLKPAAISTSPSSSSSSPTANAPTSSRGRASTSTATSTQSSANADQVAASTNNTTNNGKFSTLTGRKSSPKRSPIPFINTSPEQPLPMAASNTTPSPSTKLPFSSFSSHPFSPTTVTNTNAPFPTAVSASPTSFHSSVDANQWPTSSVNNDYTTTTKFNSSNHSTLPMPTTTVAAATTTTTTTAATSLPLASSASAKQSSPSGTMSKRAKFTSSIWTMVRRKSMDASTYEEVTGTASQQIPPPPLPSLPTNHHYQHTSSPLSPLPSNALTPQQQNNRRFMALRTAELAESARLASLKADKLDYLRKYVPDMMSLLLNDPVSPVFNNPLNIWNESHNSSSLSSASSSSLNHGLYSSNNVTTASPTTTTTTNANSTNNTMMTGNTNSNNNTNSSPSAAAAAAAAAAVAAEFGFASTGENPIQVDKRRSSNLFRAASFRIKFNRAISRASNNFTHSVSAGSLPSPGTPPSSGSSGNSTASSSVAQLNSVHSSENDLSLVQPTLRSRSTSSSTTSTVTGSSTIIGSPQTSQSAQPRAASPTTSFSSLHAQLRESNIALIRSRMNQLEQTRKEAARNLTKVAVQLQVPGVEQVSRSIQLLNEAQQGAQSASRRITALELKQVKLDLLLRDLQNHLSQEESDRIMLNTLVAASNGPSSNAASASLLAAALGSPLMDFSFPQKSFQHQQQQQQRKDQKDKSNGEWMQGPGSKALKEAKRRLQIEQEIHKGHWEAMAATEAAAGDDKDKARMKTLNSTNTIMNSNTSHSKRMSRRGNQDLQLSVQVATIGTPAAAAAAAATTAEAAGAKGPSRLSDGDSSSQSHERGRGQRSQETVVTKDLASHVGGETKTDSDRPITPPISAGEELSPKKKRASDPLAFMKREDYSHGFVEEGTTSHLIKHHSAHAVLGRRSRDRITSDLFKEGDNHQQAVEHDDHDDHDGEEEEGDVDDDDHLSSEESSVGDLVVPSQATSSRTCIRDATVSHQGSNHALRASQSRFSIANFSMAGSTCVPKSWYDLSMACETVLAPPLTSAMVAAAAAATATATGSGAATRSNPSGLVSRRSLQNVPESIPESEYGGSMYSGQTTTTMMMSNLGNAGPIGGGVGSYAPSYVPSYAPSYSGSMMMMMMNAHGDSEIQQHQQQTAQQLQQEYQQLLLEGQEIVPIEEITATEAPWMTNAYELFSRSTAMLKSAPTMTSVRPTSHTSFATSGGIPLSSPSSSAGSAVHGKPYSSSSISDATSATAEEANEADLEEMDLLNQQVRAITEANSYYFAVIQEAARQRHELRIRMNAGMIQLRDSTFETLDEIKKDISRLTSLQTHYESEISRLGVEKDHLEQEFVSQYLRTSGTSFSMIPMQQVK